MTIPVDILKNTAADFGISLDDTALARFDRYASLLLEWNEKINLTAITDPTEIAVKHFADSLTLLYAATLPANARLIDIGSGAGFPSLPVKLARGDIDVTLLDALQKRLVFIEAVSGELGIDCTLVHARAEDAGKDPKYREKFDCATARAVANLTVLSEFCLPFVKVGGQFVAMKGPDCEEEINAAEGAIGLLGGEISAVKTVNLPQAGGRTIITVKKISHTPPKYPRAYAKITKNPLRK